MKARRKGTNEPFQKVASVCLCSGGYILIKDVEFEQEPNILDHWQDVRERAAIAAMQGLLSNPEVVVSNIGIDTYRNFLVYNAKQVADVLVEKLKGK